MEFKNLSDFVVHKLFELPEFKFILYRDLKDSPNMQNEYVFDIIINLKIVVQLTCNSKISQV